MIRSVLITGANVGLGKEAARQFALRQGVDRVVLACRNPQKAEEARLELEQSTGKKVFEVLRLDVSELGSVAEAVRSLSGEVDAVILNAGGMASGPNNAAGTTAMFGNNVLGHVALVEQLLEAGKLKRAVVYAGSEAVRGVKMMGMRRPSLRTTSVEELASVIDGRFFEGSTDPVNTYGPTKYVAALWMASMARKHPSIKFVTISPGGTAGTALADQMGGVMGAMMKHLAMPAMKLFGMVHSIEDGAQRYVRAATDDAFSSGRFYASAGSGMIGPLIDQAQVFPDLANEQFQDNAYTAVRQFLK